MKITVPVRRLNSELPLPAYSKEGDAGIDLLSAEPGTIIIQPGERVLIHTGIAIDLPKGLAGFIQSRSGLALTHGVICLNAPGLIDSGYRNELSVLLLNTDQKEVYMVERGDRVAQLVIQRVETIEWLETDTLSSSERGMGGFGHTGR